MSVTSENLGKIRDDLTSLSNLWKVTACPHVWYDANIHRQRCCQCCKEWQSVRPHVWEYNWTPNCRVSFFLIRERLRFTFFNSKLSILQFPPPLPFDSVLVNNISFYKLFSWIQNPPQTTSVLNENFILRIWTQPPGLGRAREQVRHSVRDIYSRFKDIIQCMSKIFNVIHLVQMYDSKYFKEI